MRVLLLSRRCWARGHRAAAIIEFAMLAPVLITVLCGLGDFALVLFAQMLTANAANGLADLAAQSSRLQTSDITNIYNAATAMLRPLSSANLLLRITNIASDGNGRAFVYWSCGQGTLAPMAAGSNVTTVANGGAVSNYLWLNNTTSGGYTYNGTNTSFVMVEAQNTVTPPSRFVLTSTRVISLSAYTVPRLSTFVGFPWNGVATSYPPAPTTTTSTGSTSVTANGSTVTCNYSS